MHKKVYEKSAIKKGKQSSNKKWKTWKSAIKSAQQSSFPTNSAQIGTFFALLATRNLYASIHNPGVWVKNHLWVVGGGGITGGRL